MRRSPLRHAAPVLLGIALTCGVLGAQQAEAPAVEPSTSSRDLLDSVREDLVKLRFEKALAAIEAFLGRPGLTPAERAEALVLRGQAHVSFGDFDAAEQDYREILRLQPAYEPEASLTPTKALTRFRKVRAELVGRLHVTLDPADARLLVDGRETTPDPSGIIWVLAGEHRLRGERAGHDAREMTVSVAADQEVPVQIELLPNARTVVLQTEPAGVEVRLDGVVVGTTSAPAGVGAGSAGELQIDNVPLGEHLFELSKECFRTERLKDTLTVDLLDRAPKRYRPVRMTAVRARLSLRGGPAGADVLVDADRVGRLPADAPLEVCPGSREVEVRLGERVLWRQTAEVRDGQEMALPVVPRPNAALVGAERWPAALQTFGEQFNTVRQAELPPDPDVLARVEGWTALGLPRFVDLGLAVVPARRQGAADRWYLYSPILREVAALEAPPAESPRPTWSGVGWGVSVVDSVVGGAGRVVEVAAGGPAADLGLRAGDRILELGGRAIDSTAAFEATLRAASAERPLRVRWQTADGTVREGGLAGRPGPRLLSDLPSPDRAMVLAAWAVVDSIADATRAASASANLAWLFAAHDQPQLAEETWRRVQWGERRGIGEGTRQYYLGRALQSQGKEAEAIEAYRRAAATESTAIDDDGPPIAPAALDRLADLGVALERPAATAR